MNTEFKGTPGPWRVGRQNYIQTARESPLDWEGIAQYMGGGQKAEANARLIAAAPELLEALGRLVDSVNPESSGWGEAVNAIAKALGQQE